MTSIKNVLNERYQSKKLFYSIEITPKLNYLNVEYEQLPITPLFTAITWMSDDNLKYEKLKDSPALIMTKNLVDKGMPVLNHVSCYNLEEKHLDEILEMCVNIFPLKGDLTSKHSNTAYQSSNELIEEIRKKKSNNVTIFTSGYPKLNEKTEAFDMLKKKVDLGVDAMITQIVFDSETFCDFVWNCKKVDIKIPIIPGLYIPGSYNTLKRMETLTGSKVPDKILKTYECLKDLKDDDEKLKDFAVETTIKSMKDILDQVGDLVFGFHFFTLNDISLVMRVLKHFDFQ